MLFEPDQDPEPEAPRGFRERWRSLARAVGIEPGEPLVIALSGGADSVLLLHLAASQRPRPRLICVHVDHGLRGAESSEDAAFCARLCRELSVPLVRRRIELEADGPSLEARAREKRYRVLCEEARRAGARTILTGHHADDALETLLQRWLRGTEFAGLSGLRPRNPIGAEWAGFEPLAGEAPPIVVRPLIGLRREEVRRLLRDAGLAWREDSSNQSPRFTRNKIRNELLPRLEATCGPQAIESLHAFGRVVEDLEDHLSRHTAHLVWSPPAYRDAVRGHADRERGGTLRRGALMSLPRPLRRRALWRLLAEGTGHPPSKVVLELLLEDLETARATRRTLAGGWRLELRGRVLHLVPPPDPVPPLGRPRAEGRQLHLPELEGEVEDGREGLLLPTSGAVRLPDGRAVSAEIVQPTPGSPVPVSAQRVELDAEGLSGPLTVRWPRPGDRFHGLGAPGSKRLFRFLADAGVPAPDRLRVPLVFSGRELIWVAGIRPCEGRRVRRDTRRRLRLELC